MGNGDHFRWVLERQLHWIAAADTKAGGLVAAFVALTAIAVDALGATAPSAALKLLLAVSGVLMVIGLGFALAVFFPRTTAVHASMIFFGEISATPVEDFRSDAMMANSDAIIRDLVNQVHVNAVIASEKHRFVRRSLVFGGFSLAIWIPAMMIIAVSK